MHDVIILLFRAADVAAIAGLRASSDMLEHAVKKSQKVLDKNVSEGSVP